MTRHLAQQNLGNIPVLNLRIEPVAALPSFGNAGRIVYRTSDNTLQLDLGASWQNITAAGGGTPISIGSTAPSNPSVNDLWLDTN